jgi:alkylation response protein AidB-like acyl-CoA dehydrogenase
MDFQPSTEQLALQEGIRSFCADRFGADELARLEAPAPLDRDLWRELAELGVFALRSGESEGGLGLGMADAVLAFEELGRRAVPGPLVWTELAVGHVEGADSGDAIVGGLDLAGELGEPHLIEHCEGIDVLLVLREDGLYRLSPGALDATPVARPLDPLTPVCLVEALPHGERIADARTAAGLRLEGMALASALQLGIAEATLEIALAYAKEREQFGRIIGSFQAIKHMLADMFARQELARAAVYAAGATLDHPEVGDVEAACRGARIIAGESAMKNARACIQIHGGMGYTWEVPDHYYLKRCWVLESAFGSVHEHSLAIAEQVAAAGAMGDEVADGR